MAEPSRISLIARPGRLDALAAALEDTFGLTLPPAGRFNAEGGMEILWCAPGRFILQGRVPDLFERALEHLGGIAGVFDVSDATVSFRAAGPSVREGLRRLLPLDLDAPPGTVANTLAAHMNVQLRIIDATPSYELTCRRSEAESFREHLELAISK